MARPGGGGAVSPPTDPQQEHWTPDVAAPKISIEMGRICYTKADGTTLKYDLLKDIRVGRGPENDIRIKQNTVSRTHCNIYRRWAEDGSFSGDYYMQNVSTTNLTEINYVTTWGVVALRDGDIITIGERDFVFRLGQMELTLEELRILRAKDMAIGEDDDAAPLPDGGLPAAAAPPKRPSATPVQEPGWCLTPQDDFKSAPKPRQVRGALPPTAAAKQESMWDCLPNLVPVPMSAAAAANTSRKASSPEAMSGGGSNSSSSSNNNSSAPGSTGTTAAAGSSGRAEVESGGPTPLRPQGKKRTSFTPETLQRERELSRRLKDEAAQRAADESTQARAPDPDAREKQSPQPWLNGWWFTL